MDLTTVKRQLKSYIKTEEALFTKEFFGEDFVERDTMKRDILNNLYKKVSGCKRCDLHKTRTKTVFGKGSMNAKLLFVGEAPGRDEDLQGEPFVGRAGNLLTKIIEAMGLKRSNVFIANCLKCRPPQNRSPLPEELEKCEDYLIHQISAIKPRVICALGKFAAWNLLKTQEPISALRGNLYHYQDIPLIPTYHPAYLLRNPKDKVLVWKDMKKILKLLSSIK